MRKLNWLLLATVTIGGPALADAQLNYGPVPAWASLQPLVIKAKAADAAAFELLLWDTQYRLDPDAITTVVHYAARLNNPQALAAGNLTVMWDPAFDEANVNSVRIIRGSEMIDPLANGQKFTILRREQGLEQQTLDGRLTATLQTEGLQVGDIVEVTQTLVHRDPTLKGHVEANMGFAYPGRFEQARMRVVVPESLAIRQRTTGGLAAAVATRAGRDRVYQWDLSPLQPEKPAEYAPDRFVTGTGFEMTDYRSWGDLSATLFPLFEKAATIGTTSPLQAEIAGIKAASSDPKVRAALALALVESKIRYVNLALGVGGLVPANADLTWQRRFGDCKAKTVLLSGILRALGIEAVPMLVNTGSGDGLDQRLPKVSEFDHVIVRATIGGRDYWLDGTRMGDVTIETLVAPNYRWALPVTRDATLIPIVQSALTEPRREKIIVTDASKGITGPVPTTVDLIMRGDDAIIENMTLASVDAARRDEVPKQQIENLLDRFVVSKVSTSYDPLTQTFRIHGEGVQTLNITDGVYWAETPSLGYKADFRRTSSRDLDAPIALGFPSYTRTVQTMILPDALATNYPLRPADIAATVAGVEYKRTVTRKGAAVTVDTSSRSLVPEIGIAEARAAETELRRLDNDNYRFTFPVTVVPTTAEVTELIGSAPQNADDYMKAADKFGRDRKPGQAMAMLDKAVELAPRELGPRLMRASLHTSLGNDELALADINIAMKLNPTDMGVRTVHATLMLRQGNHAAAVADAQALARLDSARAQLARAQILARSDRFTEALAATDQALAYDADPLTRVFRAHLFPVGDRANRQRELDAALKLDPRDPSSLVAIAGLARELGHFDQQLALLDKAFLQSPDDLEARSQRAVALELAGRASDAAKEFDALATKSLTANEWNNLCWHKAVANIQLTRALDECDKSIAALDMAPSHDSRAFVLLRLGRFEEAIKEYDLALAGGDFSSGLYGRAIAYARAGKRAESAADAAKALRLDPLIDRQFYSFGIVL
jgi:tetratricopeptide (TPR) repeat protein